MTFTYQKPQQLDDHLWEVHGQWRNPLGRRMTVIRLQDGSLVVHNAICLLDEDLQWLKSLGSVAIVIAPNHFHCSDAAWMSQQFPQAQLFVPKCKIQKFKHLGLQPLDVNRDFPVSLKNELQCIPIQGTRWLDEAAFYHVGSRTLILCDLAFNMPDCYHGLAKVMMDWNKVGGCFGPSRLTKLLFMKNRQQMMDSYQGLLALDFKRVIVNHGLVLNENSKALLRQGIRNVFGQSIS